MNIKPGYKTTEFLLFAILIAVDVTSCLVNGGQPVISGFAATAYAAIRTYAKIKSPAIVDKAEAVAEAIKEVVGHHDSPQSQESPFIIDEEDWTDRVADIDPIQVK